MDGVDRTMRRKSLKERLGLKGISCCGATWTEDDGSPMGLQIDFIEVVPEPIEHGPDPPCDEETQSQAATGMNLAAALAAERQFRASQDSDNGGDSLSSSSITVGTAGTVPGTPSRVSLMRLLEEADGYDGEMKKEEEGVGCDSVCCVCMGRKKGAAFIPCGHTFCRVCSRELWLNRGSCPLCNRSVIEILDIY